MTRSAAWFPDAIAFPTDNPPLWLPNKYNIIIHNKQQKFILILIDMIQYLLKGPEEAIDIYKYEGLTIRNQT